MKQHVEAGGVVLEDLVVGNHVIRIEVTRFSLGELGIEIDNGCGSRCIAFARTGQEALEVLQGWAWAFGQVSNLLASQLGLELGDPAKWERRNV